MATLTGFTAVPEAATVGGAPIDAFQADAFRRNDILFEQVIQSLMCSPFMPTSAIGVGSGDVVASADSFAREFINAKNINVTAKCTLTARVPLIWIARERIIIGAEIDASGKGAQAEEGDFGGSGGGGATAGFRCLMPFVPTATVKPEEQILVGGAAGAVGINLSTADAWKLSRALLFLPFLVGGAAGSDGGGEGGGVVCLCAPVIEFRTGGLINAAGKPAITNNKGGGGGGLVYLIARQIIGANEGTNIKVTGGLAAGGTGRAGGSGRYIPHEFR